jgi:SET domain-containing protein
MLRTRPAFVKLRSTIHGLGVFAARRIRRGRRLIDYAGEVLTTADVRSRYDDAAADNPHTLLFHVGRNHYLDASVGGNDARFINHSCDPNCEAEASDGSVSIRAIRNIQPGVELTYDYALEIENGATRSRRDLYPCRCGAAACRGTMLSGSGRRRVTR